MFWCSHTILGELIIRAFASTDNELPDVGVTTLKHVEAILM